MPPAQVPSAYPQAGRMDARYAAAIVITEVIRNRRYLEQSLARHLATMTDSRDKALASEICYGVMRWYPRLVFITNLLLKTPLKARDTDILALIYSGLYQLIFLRIPDHAAISATVETARKLQKSWAGNLVNAVLRRYQRECSQLENRINDSEVAVWAHPEWLICELRRQWPQHWQKILDANNQYPPLQLRLNLKRQTREQYLLGLQQAGIEATPAKIVDTGLTVCNPVNVEDIPGFKQGEVSVQDYGAQLAAPLLDTHPGQRVLDACAAPGGKTAHIHERTPDLEELVAVELDAHRVELLRNTIDRLDLRVSVIHADVCDTGSWWDGRHFDSILVDAPCSATGVIRRHPDIKYLRTAEQLAQYTHTQQYMLESLWPLLKPGGRMVYVTCSIFRQEGNNQIKTFSAGYDTVFEQINAGWGIRSECGQYTLPGYGETDGFFYSVLTKPLDR